MRHARTRPTNRGFTLVELLVVMAIIGLLVSFILVAASGGVRRAEEKATLGLIAKLDMGLSERMEAILIRRADIYPAHVDMAAIYTSSGRMITAPQRAQVIAQFDLVRAQIPDVFFVQNNPNYPINFAGVPYPNNSAGINSVPLGSIPGNSQFPVLGAYGATWQAMAGIHKRLGYLPSGYDGTDNNGNGLIDDLVEGIGANPNVDDPDNPRSQIPLSQLIARRLANHTHKTARSEMLYALLVEGQGPLGSIFSADEFTSREVRDTDNDGLPEFVDAWGEPLQFYRWPIYYNGDYRPDPSNPSATITPTASYIQKGMLPYNPLNASEPRQLDPLDPGQQLMSPAWFSPASNLQSGIVPFSSFAPGPNYSAGALAFMTYFHSLLDPNYPPPSANLRTTVWDRSGAFARRAFYSRPLIISSGPDKELGLAQIQISTTPALTALQLIAIENQAAAIDPIRTGSFLEKERNPGANPISAALQLSGQDDISNHSLASPGGGSR